MVIDYKDLITKLLKKNRRYEITEREFKMLTKLNEWYANSLEQMQMNIK